MWKLVWISKNNADKYFTMSKAELLNILEILFFSQIAELMFHVEELRGK